MKASYLYFIMLALPLIALSGCGKATAKPAPETSITRKLEALRASGQPVTLAELNGWYVEPPASENAAPLYAEAFAALANEDARSAAFLSQNQAAVALLHKAAAHSGCRYPLDLGEGAAGKVPHLTKVKISAQLLARDAAANAAKGRADLAAQSLEDGFRVAQSLAQEPLLISQLVRMASTSTVETGLEAVLSSKALNPQQLDAMEARARESLEVPVLGRAIPGERCLLLGVFQAAPQAAAALQQTDNPLANPAALEAYRRTPAFTADFNLCLDYFSNLLALAALPFPARLESGNQWARAAETQLAEAKAKGCKISPAFLPSLSGVLEREADYTAQLRAVLLALGVERYRSANNQRLPQSLDELVPAFLAAVPGDPYGTQPLRYKKLPTKGYVIYSLGRDREDNGGALRPPGGKADGPYDLAFTVHR